MNSNPSGDTKASDSLTSSNAVTAEELRANIKSDKARALEAIGKAREELSSGHHYEFATDITGTPSAAVYHSEYVRNQMRALESVIREPYFCRINTTLTMRGESEPMQLLISKARDIGGVVYGDGWQLVSWTSPIANLIQGKRPGDIVEFTRRSTSTYEVDESSRYEALLPQIENAVFALRNGDAALVEEADIEQLYADASPPSTLPTSSYSANPTFGLSDIIVLVDEPQRAAMALPFSDSIVIEGPPGSGKTSIGIMRIAVLYDQQWEALGLKRDQDRPFHDYSTMRVLVYNEEMVEYLRGLAQSIGVERVFVETTKDYFRRMCRATRLLTGTERRDKPSLSVLKGRREALSAYFAGFRSHAQKYWDSHKDTVRRQLFELAPDFLWLADRLDQWVARVQQAEVREGRISGAIGLADMLTQTIESIRSGRSRTRHATSWDHGAGDGHRPVVDIDSIVSRTKEARVVIENAVRGCCSRTGIVTEMFEQPEYRQLLAHLRSVGVPDKTIEDGDRLWRTQYKGDLPAYSELDLAMTAWLGAPILLSSADRDKPWIGARLERSTHLVVDEAQDLSPSHIAVLASQLDRQGTMTLVGDIHQNLNPHAGLQSWSDAGLPNVARTAFGVNHRQTFQLGSFLAILHEELFDEPCPWKPSEKLVGRIPRVGVARSWEAMSAAIAREAIQWREAIEGETGATIAVLYDGRMQPKRLRWLQNQLELALSDQLIPVEVAMPGDGGDALRKTDRVVVASVRQTKGLEFDAVVFIEPRPRWSKHLQDIDLRIRNGLYVATSRGRAGLSLCMSNLPSCIESMAERELCEPVSWDLED